MTFPPWIVKVKWLKIKEGYKARGMAVFPFIFINGDASRTLIEHEKIHIKQQITHLWIFFFIKYAIYHVIYGYDKNPFEVYAYKHQDDWRPADWEGHYETLDSGPPENKK